MKNVEFQMEMIRSLPLAVLKRVRVVLVQMDRSPVLKNYKLLAAFQDQRDALPHSIECASQFCSRESQTSVPAIKRARPWHTPCSSSARQKRQQRVVNRVRLCD